MKILWVSNIIFPEACQKLNITAPVVGGWMQSAAKSLIELNKDIKLAVISLYNGKALLKITDFPILYYLIPNKKGNQIYNPQLEKFFSQIEKDCIKPRLTRFLGLSSPPTSPHHDPIT